MNRATIAAVAALAAPLLAAGVLAITYAAGDRQTHTCPSGTGTGAGTGGATAAGPCAPPGPQAPARPFPGGTAMVPDPSGTGGRVTERMAWAYHEVARVFAWPWGIGCWDPHLWNPTSDHPKGRACDFTVGAIGVRPTPAQRVIGWQLAHWLQADAAALGVSYVIWDGHIWSAARSREGWRVYDGGGIYDPTSITGGHHDHVHLSVE